MLSLCRLFDPASGPLNDHVVLVLRCVEEVVQQHFKVSHGTRHYHATATSQVVQQHYKVCHGTRHCHAIATSMARDYHSRIHLSAFCAAR